ncbi:TetR/AcrR family transcriptional regulator [Rhizobacter sp. LjRoot28]|jgi:AcrR family transcriptional regulator|uniref:TetR/AcrR family transcriptional regulator n=1 Tax=Rhizobacter sp. LjRoot28 TaxID=3342309 RepID=UPI003ED03320
MRSETQIVEKQKTATGTGRKREKSEQTLAAIVNSAMDLTARHGLQNLALGDIAKQLGISKSGVFVRVGSLEALQLLVVDECERQFRDMVLIPTLSEKPGLPQVDAVVRLWIAHGGSMKALLGAHYESQSGEDVSELGRRLQSGMSNWRKRLEGLVAHAVKLGQLRGDTDPGQLVFEIFGLMLGYLYDTRMSQDPRHQARALAAYYRIRSTYVSFTA